MARSAPSAYGSSSGPASTLAGELARAERREARRTVVGLILHRRRGGEPEHAPSGVADALARARVVVPVPERDDVLVEADGDARAADLGPAVGLRPAGLVIELRAHTSVRGGAAGSTRGARTMSPTTARTRSSQTRSETPLRRRRIHFPPAALTGSSQMGRRTPAWKRR
jgi:hypothetical protein